MTQTQKIIKYLALALAAGIIISIFSGIYSLGSLIFGIADVADTIGEINTSEVKSSIVPDGEVSELYIDILAADMTVKTGDKLSVETDSKHITLRQNGKCLEITEKKRDLFNIGRAGKIVITLPDGFKLDKAEIEAGAGNIDVETLSAEELQMELGAGEVRLAKLNITDKCEIGGGAGEINITSSVINDLELDMGVGELKMEARLVGDGFADCGIGEVNITLLGVESDYRVHINKGLGEAIVNGKDMRDDQSYGNGRSRLEIDGGVGSINVDFTNR